MLSEARRYTAVQNLQVGAAIAAVPAAARIPNLKKTSLSVQKSIWARVPNETSSQLSRLGEHPMYIMGMVAPGDELDALGRMQALSQMKRMRSLSSRFAWS